MAAKKKSVTKTSPKTDSKSKKKTSPKSESATTKIDVKTKPSRETKPASVIDVGSKAPTFSLTDQSGSLVRSRDLAGKPYVLYFYPKDDTPGCTREACDFRDQHQTFRRRGIEVFGVSPDSAQSHAKFAKKYELPFRLLVDEDKELSQSYGVWGLKKNYGKEYWGIVRSTFLIGADGRVQAVYRGVRVDGHVDQVLTSAEELAS